MTLIFILLRVSVLLAVVVLVHTAAARQMSAAMRHFVWTLAVIGVLLLPALTIALPEWPVLTLSQTNAPESAADVKLIDDAVDQIIPTQASSLPSTQQRSIPAPIVWMVLYTVVALVLSARLILERLSLRRLARRASAIDDAEWNGLLRECARQMGVRCRVRLILGSEETMPMTFGTRQPTIVIPAGADEWSQSRRRAVLLHELAHVARYDCLTQTLAAAACAVYWMHPMVWWIARQLRVERELACDDRVLAAGAQPREYAGHLLDLAYTLGSQRAPVLAVSMAASSQIEGRMLAVLDERRNRVAPTLHVRVIAAVASIVLVVPLAVVTSAVERPTGPTAIAAPAEQRSEFAQRTATATAQQPGTWEIRTSGDARTLHLRLTDSDGSYGSNIDLDQLSGLPPAVLSGPGGAVQFTLRRDAGAFQFEGIFRGGVGAGTYTFAPSAEFAAGLAKRGLAQPTPAEQYLLARANFGFAFLDELAAQNYVRPDLAQVIRALHHGVSVTYLRAMRQLGFRLKTIEGLITLRDHGVSPEYVRDLAAEGLKGLTTDDLVRARSHGISAEYVRDLRVLGYAGLSLDTLAQLRSHGVSPEYLRELQGLGYSKLPLDTVIQLRSHGVSSEFVREVQGLGYSSVTIDDLVGLRSHGVSPERIRTANTKAGKRLTIDELKSAASHGWREYR